MTTPDLVRSLVASATPVRRLRPPVLRATLWLLLAGGLLLVLTALFGLRADLAAKLRSPVFVLSIAASLLTGILAAFAAFLVSLPDRSRGWLALPVPPLLLWLATIGYGCLTDWVAIEPGGVTLGTTATCFLTLLLTSVPLTAALVPMLRHAAILGDRATMMAGATSVGAITATALMLVHELDASTLVVLWNLGVLALFLGLGRVLPPSVLARMVPEPRTAKPARP